MIAVECVTKSGRYWRQVCAGVFTNEPLTGKNTSVGLRASCTIAFTAAQVATRRTVPRTIRLANVADCKVRRARRADECAQRLRIGAFRRAPREVEINMSI